MQPKRLHFSTWNIFKINVNCTTSLKQHCELEYSPRRRNARGGLLCQIPEM